MRARRERVTAVADYRVAVLAVAAVATVGSLWFSEGLGLIPCKLCWYQRILMYPIVPIVAIALFERRDPRWTVLVLSVPGFAVAAYHNYVQMVPSAGSCTAPVPCSTVQYRAFGLTIPQMSLTAFGLITATVLLVVALDGSAATAPDGGDRRP